MRFPVGLVAEPAALPGMFGGGFWNPAATLLPAGASWRLSAGAMSTPSDVSVSAHAGAATGLWRGSTITVSVVRASVAGIVRTDSDPLTVGNDLLYATTVVSLGVAHRLLNHVAWGLAVRVRTGQIDFESRTAVSLDGGLVAEHFSRLDARVGLSTFLASPWSSGKEHMSVVAAADVRIVQADSDRAVRTGVAFTTTQGGDTEQFAFVSGRYRAWEVRGGPVRTTAYDGENYRGRMAIAVHYAGYSVGVAREGTPGGLGPTYQFVLSSLMR